MKWPFHLIYRTSPFVGSLAIATLVHLALIGINANHENSKLPARGALQNDAPIDNTIQLIRLTKLNAQNRIQQSKDLQLSPTLPPPPPELKEAPVEGAPVDSKQDCEPRVMQHTGGERDGMPITTRGSLNPNQNPAQSKEDDANQSSLGDGASEGKRGSGLPDSESIETIWRKAMGVPIWPTDLGERDQSVELKELSLAFFSNLIEKKDLNDLEIHTTSNRYRFQIIGQRVFILKDPLRTKTEALD